MSNLMEILFKVEGVILGGIAVAIALLLFKTLADKRKDDGK